jgi:hypothetical protein
VNKSLAGLPDRATIAGWQAYMNQLGPRLTGTAAHQRFIEFLREQITAIGYQVETDRHYFQKWEAEQANLHLLAADGTEQEIRVASIYPYSGMTSSQGIEGELVYCGKGKGSYKHARGKIAVVEVAVWPLPTTLLMKQRAVFPDDAKLSFFLQNPVLQSFLGVPDLKKATEAGALAVIGIWRNISTANARDQYLPFGNDYQGLPGVWVDREAREALLEGISKKKRARLTLSASLQEQAASETIYAVVPGKTDKEVILVNTHTDGPNGIEENGGLGMLAMMHFLRNQAEKPERTMLFVFVTGHFQLEQFGLNHRQATSRWLRDHPELWEGKEGHARAVAGLTLEHLGCMEWSDNRDKTDFLPTGRIAPELVYTANKELAALYLQALQGRKKVRTVLLRPRNRIYFGEGQPLFQEGIPTVSLIPGPDYLCTAPDHAEADKIDGELMYEQIETFAKLMMELDKTSVDKIGKVEPESFGIW